MSSPQSTRVGAPSSCPPHGNNAIRIWRLGPSGAVDRSFGVSGAVTVRRDVTVNHARADRRGGLLIAGDGRDAAGMPVMVVLRVGARALDTNYGVRGVATTQVVYDGDVAFDRAGGFLVAGQASTRRGDGTFMVERFGPDGRIVETYGDGGRRELPGAGAGGGTYAAVLADGSALLAVPSRSATTMVRLDPAGTPTTHFGPTGMRTVARGFHLVARADGRFLLRDVRHVRQYLADGTVDPAFGRRGVAAVAVGGLGVPGPPLLQPNGALIVPTTVPERVPGFGMDPNGWDVSLVRLRPQGTVDTRFGSAGRATLRIPLDQQSGGQMQNLALRADGSIVGAWKSSRTGSESPNALRWVGVVVGGFR